MKEYNREKSSMSPLFTLRSSLMEAARTAVIPLTENGVPVVKPIFDPYRSTLISPDHLLAGIAINILTVGFLLLPNDHYRQLADLFLCDALDKNSVIKQNKVYSLDDKKLYSTTISGTFCILVFSGAVFTELSHILSKDSSSALWTKTAKKLFTKTVEIIVLFRDIVARTHWHPRLMVSKQFRSSMQGMVMSD